jgi:two-component sensor histidine kinase
MNANRAVRKAVNPAPPAMRKLLLENARLKRFCAQTKEMVLRYDLLLREGDHRIKNSLQVVVSLLNLQESREASPTARDALRAASARIHAVASIHDALQLNGSADMVDLGRLIERICRSLYAMAGDPRLLKIVVDAKPIMAPLDLAQPIVLAVNELVINALRHAFPNGQSGEIIVSLRSVGGELRLLVADNGTGLPPDYLQAPGYGMKLVNAMVEKIGGRIQASNSGGACFTLDLPSEIESAFVPAPLARC